MKVIVYGLGEMGKRMAERILASDALDLVGAIDIDPQKVGRDVGELLGRSPIGVTVEDNAEKVLTDHPGAFVVHTTVSQLEKAAPQILQILETGHSGVSTTEELSYPWVRHPDLARKLDTVAKEHQRTFVGTGVNPGFLMDYFPAVVAALSSGIQSITVRRYVNASLRRKPLQAKIGSGLTPMEFKRLFDEGKMGHVGLVESAQLLARLLQWELKDLKETCDPIVANETVQTEFFKVEPGFVRGMRHQVKAVDTRGRTIHLDLLMALDHPEQYDEVEIEGTPPVRVRFPEGVHGDMATVNVTLSVLRRVPDLPPGLLNMADLPLPIPV